MHDLLDREPMLTNLKEHWGEEMVKDGIADRNRIGARVFNDPEELTWLEQQIHPLVQTEIAGWFGGLPEETKVAVVEVPLLFEGAMADRFDTTVAIVADEATRSERARSRGHEGVEGRETRQLSQADKATRADHVISNDGTPEELQENLSRLLDELVA